MKKYLALLLALALTLSLIPAAVAAEPAAALPEVERRGDYQPMGYAELTLPGPAEEQGTLMEGPVATSFTDVCDKLHETFTNPAGAWQIQSQFPEANSMTWGADLKVTVTDENGNVTEKTISGWLVYATFDNLGYRVDSEADLETVFTHIRNLYGDLFAVRSVFIPISNTQTKALTGLAVLYDDTLLPKKDDNTPDFNTYNAAVKVYNDGVADIVNKAKTECTTDLEKIVFVNDYITTNFEYCDTAHPENYTYDVYSFFQNKTGVCQAYSLLFSDVMAKLGIQNNYVQSDYINHIWNMVQVNGKWYHLDATWNDPAGVPYYVNHNYLLTSHDYMITDAGHHTKTVDGTPQTADSLDWVFGNQLGFDTTSYNDPCTDKTYDTAIWAGEEPTVKSPFVWANGKAYCMSESALNTWNGTATDVTALTKKADIATGSNVCSYAGLTYYGGHLYYNTEATLERYSLFIPNAQAETIETDNNSFSFGSTLEKANDGTLTYYYQIGTPGAGNTIKPGECKTYTGISPFHRVKTDGLGYYLDGNELYVDVPDGEKAVTATYEASGKMSKFQELAEGTGYALPKDGTMKLFSLQDWKPLAPAATVGWQ